MGEVEVSAVLCAFASGVTDLTGAAIYPDAAALRRPARLIPANQRHLFQEQKWAENSLF